MDARSDKPRWVGRAAAANVPNRFERQVLVEDLEQLEQDDRLAAQRRDVPTQFLPDASRTIIRENDSPDIPFRFSINPYRGCEHGCAYCYARPTHETLGMDAGLDFETKILVKHEAPRLLRDELNRPSWQGEPITISGVTDCYQPIERKLRLMRRCVEVLCEARQSFSVVTKNALVLRDLDLLTAMAELGLVHIYLSLTTLDAELARTMEPRTSTPEARLRAIRELAAASVPVGVMLAPVIPGLNDEEIPSLLAAAEQAGAGSAAYTLLRLPLSVRPIFEDWLASNYPQRRERIEARIRGTRDGKMSDPRFGSRMRGEGNYAEQIKQTFKVFAAKHGLDRRLPPLDRTHFRPPRSASGQMRLF